MNPSERLAEIEARVKEFYALGDDWPNLKKKKLIGEDIPWLLELVREARRLLLEAHGWMNGVEPKPAQPFLDEVRRAALADSGEASGEAG